MLTSKWTWLINVNVLVHMCLMHCLSLNKRDGGMEGAWRGGMEGGIDGVCV